MLASANDLAGVSGAFGFTQMHSSTEQRVSPLGIRIVADNSGSVDDRLACEEIPTAKVISVTSIIVFDWMATGNNQANLMNTNAGHYVRHDSIGNALGYKGNNGANFYHMYPGYGDSARIGKRSIAVVSTDLNNKILSTALSIDGVLQESTGDSGVASYIGGGNIGSTYPWYIGNSEYTNYYHVNGRLQLFAVLPGIALDQSGVDDLAANPWQLFRAEPTRIYSFPSGPIIPVLSAASFAARAPSVTVTY